MGGHSHHRDWIDLRSGRRLVVLAGPLRVAVHVRASEGVTMPIQFLLTDHAFALAKAILGIFEPSPEEKQVVFGRVFEACKAVLEAYEEKADRLNRRIHLTNKQ
jgi:hypothetical protein